MKRFNLLNETIVTNKVELLGAINSSKIFAINIKGKILYEPFSSEDILIFIKEGDNTISSDGIKYETILGYGYGIVEHEDTISIKAYSNWKDIVRWNTTHASYFNGVMEFSNKDLEDIRWHAKEFGISYKELIDLLEKKCDGTLLYVEQEEPFIFSTIGFLKDNDNAKEVLFRFCQTIVKNMIENDDDLEIANMEDDEAFAASFFEAL